MAREGTGVKPAPVSGEGTHGVEVAAETGIKPAPVLAGQEGSHGVQLAGNEGGHPAPVSGNDGGKPSMTMAAKGGVKTRAAENGIRPVRIASACIRP
jgi:hypothetical protein